MSDEQIETKMGETVQNCAKNDKFVPTSAMFKWWAKSIELRTSSKTRIADEIGIHRNTYYSWLAIPGFKDWLKMQEEEFMREMKHELLKIGLQLARRNLNAWLVMAEISGLIHLNNTNMILKKGV
jgi:hypothetical protein